MFDFEKLLVYQQAKALNKQILNLFKENKFDPFLKDQLKRASISIMLNIAEGSGKFSFADKRNFYTIARGSTYECVAIFQIMSEDCSISQAAFDSYYAKLENISKMLLGLINSHR